MEVQEQIRHKVLFAVHEVVVLGNYFKVSLYCVNYYNIIKKYFNSSPARSPISGDDQVAAMSALFATRFPHAQQQMEERLRNLAAEPPPRSAPPIVRFVHHQVCLF